MVKIPDFVFSHLIVNNYIGKTRTLIIGENYPGPNYAANYFYRSIPGCPGGPAVGRPPAFFTRLCNALLVPHLNLVGGALTEFERLNKFLESGFLLIDAQQDLVPAIRPAALTPIEIENLLKTILLINPKNIMFLGDNNLHVITSLALHPLFSSIADKILYNFLVGSQVFSFHFVRPPFASFVDQINHARNFYFI